MATRLYFTNAQATLTVTSDVSWEGTINPFIRRVLSPERIGTEFASHTFAKTTTSTTFDGLVAQFITPPLAAQTVSGNVKGIIRALESATGNDMRAQMLIRVIGWDGVTFRGTLLAHDASALTSEFAATLTNRKFPLNWTAPGAALTPVACQAGDRIVVEVGYRSHVATLSITGTLEFGDQSVTDLAEDEVGTTQNNPWVEFSNDLVFETSWSGRSAPGSDLLTQLGRFNRAGVQMAAESYSLKGFVPVGQDNRGQLRARTSSANYELGEFDTNTNSRYGGFEPGVALGQDGGTLRSPIGGGGYPSGSSAVEKFKMRALANPGPGYVTWVVSGSPDFTGAQAPGAIQVGTAVVADAWTEV